VAAANDVAAGRHGGCFADSGAKPLQDSGIDTSDLAGRTRPPGSGGAGPRNGSLVRNGHRQISPPRPHGRSAFTGARRAHRAVAATRRHDHRQAGGVSQTERAIGSGRRIEEALNSRF
jgi:hypothetical protein